MTEVILFAVSIICVAAVAIVAIALTLKHQKSFQQIEQQLVRNKITLPLRLQAYERCVVFLERISPDSLVVRVNKGEDTVASLQARLLSTIRTEFEHNISQQLYVSPESWVYVVNAKNNIVGLVNSCSSKLHPDMRAIELSKLIIEAYANIETSPTALAKQKIKQEVALLY
ncbi:hypothetical protein [uncultured Acetobacteroides sp.]|uniref:DUF7935 family protein n=1 Tax=uncultured Acetobacteroides sp. TaxID=1760811 RepID=UPI0029F59137|nr:hypothetical protein [uncultured Acetobacteroides sp.]